MQTFEARDIARELYGPNGCARAVRYINSQGHFAFDYRIGVFENHRYVDYARGVNYEACIRQAEKILQHKAALRRPENKRKTLDDIMPPTARQKLLAELIAERNPLRRHNMASKYIGIPVSR